MGIQKTSAVILSVLPYRESSAILTLFTNDHGRVSGIAKGVKRRSKGQASLERGFLIDLILYVKNNRDLHTLADINIIEYFPLIRVDLYKTAIRDAAFELILKSVILSESHPELFSLLHEFLETLQSTNTKENVFVLLWKFYFKAADLLGFAIHFESCRNCGQSQLIFQGGFFAVESGGLFCNLCAAKRSMADTYIDSKILQVLAGSSLPLNISSRELVRMTKLIASYCRFHLDIKPDFKSLEFIEQMGL